MKDVFDKLAADIKRDLINTCAKVAEIHRIPIAVGTIRHPLGSYADGYNSAVADIAAKIREL